jgi:hypothetical protein
MISMKSSKSERGIARRSTVLILPFQLGFPARNIQAYFATGVNYKSKMFMRSSTGRMHIRLPRGVNVVKNIFASTD